MNVVINQKFLNGLKTTKLKELKLEEDLKEGTGQEKKYTDFLTLMQDYDLRTVIDTMEAMPKLIDKALRKENEDRQLATLKIEFLNG